jgi:hypothetical protein
MTCGLPLNRTMKAPANDPNDAFVFPGMKRGRPLSNMTFLMLLRRMGGTASRRTVSVRRSAIGLPNAAFPMKCAS